METSNYIYNLNTLYNAYNSEADVQSKSKLDEETKMLNPETNNENIIKRAQNDKLPYKFKLGEKEKKYCHICHKDYHNTDECYLNLLNISNSNLDLENYCLNGQSERITRVRHYDGKLEDNYISLKEVYYDLNILNNFIIYSLINIIDLKLWHTIHLDVVGPLQPSPSFNEYKYYIIFIDNYLRKSVRKFIAERMNYTLDNCAKTLLNVPFLSSIFWDEAVACTFLNIQSHSIITVIGAYFNYNTPDSLNNNE
ncbi:hypothetical protein H8356DRAFT_1425651 [Neocallimastix lanati (nom. inval.)]|nr:hypothetical protein H8356DRAFT_1425651 [Neocallimastix sp. JGI-2020a]